MSPGLAAQGSGHQGAGSRAGSRGFWEDFLEEGMLKGSDGGLVAEDGEGFAGGRTCMGGGLEIRTLWQAGGRGSCL